ncbi:hypothetical protein DXG03_006535, partial [Asterophora parasitica]
MTDGKAEMWDALDAGNFNIELDDPEQQQNQQQQQFKKKLEEFGVWGTIGHAPPDFKDTNTMQMAEEEQILADVLENL